MEPRTRPLKRPLAVLMVFLSLFIGVASAQKSKKIPPPLDLVKFFKVKASDLTVLSADVTGDGKPEYFVSNKNFCGNRCSTTLYQRKDKGFIVLFEIDTYLDVDEGWSEGYRNIVDFDWAGSVYLRTHYRWNGREYVRFKCTEEERFGEKKGTKRQVQCENY